MRNATVVVAVGLVLGALAFAEPERGLQPEDPNPQLAPDPVLQNATPVERAILARLDRIERGLFRERSTLPRSEKDSVELRLEQLLVEIRAERPAERLGNDGARIRDLDRDLRELDDRVSRDVERPVNDLTRRVQDVEREVDRIEARAGDIRAIEDLRRSLGRLERQIASIERRIR